MSADPASADEGRRPAVEERQLADALEACRPRLRRMVQVRLDPRLRGRVDPSDVIQEDFVDVAARLHEPRDESKLPFPLWVRLLTGHKLLEIHRRHLGAAMRDARREAKGAQHELPEASSISLLSALADGGTSPSGALWPSCRAHLPPGRSHLQRVHVPQGQGRWSCPNARPSPAGGFLADARLPGFHATAKLVGSEK